MEHSLTDLSKYRYECCIDNLDTAKFAYENKRYSFSIDRSFFSSEKYAKK